jgi:hypothetical protein
MSELETRELETSELEIEILKKRRALHNLIDRADAARRGLNCLNYDIEKEKRELTLLERTLRVKVLLDGYRKDEMEKLDIESLKKVFNTLGNEDVELLFAELHKTENIGERDGVK